MSRKRLPKLSVLKQGVFAVEVAERLASFGKRHKLTLRGLKIKDLINDGRR
jgi:hypothetical protein